MAQQYWMSKLPSYLDVLEKRKLELQSKIDRTWVVQEKPTFNISPTPQTPAPVLNFGAPMSGTTQFSESWIKQAPKTAPKPTTPSSGGFSLVPKANAWDVDFIQSFLNDTKWNVDFERKRNAVVEMLKNWEDEAFIEDAIINKMWYKPTQPTQEKPWLWSQLWTAAKESLPNPMNILEVWGNVAKWLEKNITGAVNIAASPFWVSPMRTPSEAIMGVEKATPSLLERSVATVWQRGQELWDIITAEWQTTPESVFQWTMKVARGLLDIWWDAFMSALSTASTQEQKDFVKQELQKAVETKGWEYVMQKMQEAQRDMETLRELDPRAARNFEAVFTLLEWAWEAVWLWTGTRTLKATWRATTEALDAIPWQVMQWAEKAWQVLWKWADIVTDTTKWVVDATKKTWDNIRATKEQVISGLTKEQIKWYQSNPYQAEEFNKLTERLESPEWISDVKDYKVERVWAVTKELTDEIDKIRATKWETWKAYEIVKQLPVEVKTDDIFKWFESTLKNNWMDFKDWVIVRIPWSKAKDLNQADINKFNQLYQDILADSSKWYLTPEEILTFRKTVSDLAKYDATTTSTWQWILKSIRKIIDNQAKAQIPWLKELDAQFVDKLDELENAIMDLVYKQWDVKWEWRSNIVNIVWTLDRANRAKLLTRLDEVMPWIWEKIQAIDNIWSIFKSLQDQWIFEKFTWFGWAVAWATSLWAVLPVIWHVVWAILWLAGWKLLETWITSAKKVALNKILSKISKEWVERMKEIDTKIKNNQKLREWDEEFLNNLKQKFQDEIRKSKNNSGNSNTRMPLTPMSSRSTSNNTAKKVEAAKKSFQELTWKPLKPLNKSPLSERERKLLKPDIKAPVKTQLETTLKWATTSNIDEVTQSVAKTLKTTKTAEIKAIIQRYLKEFGKDFKNKIGEMIEEIASKVWAKLNLISDKQGIWVEKTALLKGSDDFLLSPEDLSKKFTWRDNLETNLKTLKTISPDGYSLEKVDINKLNHNIRADDFENPKDSLWKIEWIIKEYKKTGKIQPLIIDSKWNVMDGNHRINAYKQLWIKEIPVYFPIMSDIKKIDNLATRLLKEWQTLSDYYKWQNIYEQAQKSKPLKKAEPKGSDDLIKYSKDKITITWKWELNYEIWKGVMDIDLIKVSDKRQWIWTKLMKEAEKIAKEKWLKKIQLSAQKVWDTTLEELDKFYVKNWYIKDKYFDWIYYKIIKD